MLGRLQPTSLLALLAAALLGRWSALVGWSPPQSSSSSSTNPKTSAVVEGHSNPRQAIFDELTAAETIAVAKYVMEQMPGVKSSMYPDGFTDGDYISGTSAVELIAPTKADALAYIDGKTEERPPRFARVTIVHGSKLGVMEYKVGPIHGCDHNSCESASVQKGSSLVPLVKEGAIPFEKRPMDMADVTPMALAGEQVFEPLKELLLESFGPVFDDNFYPGCGEACFSGKAGMLFPFPFNDISSTSKQRVSKLQFFWYAEAGNFQAIWLHGLPFSFRVAQVGKDLADWRVYDLYYCGQGPYKTADALLAAKPTKCTYKPDPATEGKKGAWDIPGASKTTKERVSHPAIPPPVPRYTLDGAGGGGGRLVRWMGWQFFVTMRPSTGLAAMDIRFQGQRIAYELALAEAAAHYSGTGADQVYYLDSAYSMSQLGGDMKPGIDCPAYATYLDGTQWVGQHDEGGAITDMDSDVARARPYKALCIFEEVSQSSHWRHLQFLTKKVDGVPSSALIVRAVTAVGNYDYITELGFHLDGSVRVKFDFAGYMETRWFSQEQTPWERSLGEVVRRNLVAPLHSHFGCFKVDLDGLGGSGESLETVRIASGMRSDLVPDLRGFATKYVERTIVQKEGVGVSTFVPSSASPTSFAIVDNSKRHAAARDEDADAQPTSPPGYMIMPGPTVAQTLPEEHPFVKASAFSKYTLAVTKRKDAEYRPTSVYDLFGPAEPQVSLDSFIDGESIEQTDLVAWVTLGKEHLPRTEDLPLISNFGTYFDLLPRNVHDVNAAMDVF